MLALPVDRQLERAVWHADDSLVLAGELLRTTSTTHRAAIRERLLEIHRFLGEEFGCGGRVRALAVYDDGADEYVREPGQFSAR